MKLPSYILDCNVKLMKLDYRCSMIGNLSFNLPDRQTYFY